MEGKSIPFQFLDESVLTFGVRVLMSGVDVSQFERNPVMLYDHNDWNMPIGQWSNIRKEGGRIMGDAEFDYDDKDESVQRIIGKVERGVIKMCSVGIVDIEASDDPMYKIDGQDGPTIVRCRLREVSITPIGANHNAMRLYGKDGKEITPSDGKTMKLSDFSDNNFINDKKMSKKYLDLLNLTDKATDAEIESAIGTLLSDKQKAEKENGDLKVKNKELSDKLDGIEASEKEARKKDAEALVDAALKDGRISEKEDGKGTVRKGWLDMFDQNYDNAKTMLESLAKRQSVKDGIQLGDGGEGSQKKESAWVKRQQEIEVKNERR